MSILFFGGCGAADLVDPPIDTGSIDVTGVSVSSTSNEVGIGGMLQLISTVTPAGADQSVTWTSDDETRITVSAAGLVTAALAPLVAGTVRITATSTEDPSIAGSVDLTITCGPLAASAVSNGGTLPEDTCYVVETSLTVLDGTLVVEAGVRISFGSGGSLSIGSNGRLNATGTVAKGIVFTSTDPVGTWRGVRFDNSRSADNVLLYVTIENGGSSGWSGATYSASALLLEGNSLIDIQQSTIRGSASRGITLYRDAEMTFVQNTLEQNGVPAWMHPNTVRFLDDASAFDGNTDDVVRVGFGNNDRVSTAQTWPNVGVPLELQERMFIEAPLTLAPGVTLEARAGVGLVVQAGGAVSALGTVQEPITFGSSEGAPGTWKGLQIGTQSNDNIFDYVVFENGGSDPWTGASDSRAMVYLDGNSKAVFTNTTFHGSAHYALWVPSGGDIAGFDGNTFTNNVRPMIVHPNRAGDIAANTSFADNDEQSVRVTFGNNDRVLASQTWSALAVPYRVMVRTFIAAPLSIEAGAVVEFAQSANFVVTESGTLSALGTVSSRIQFRGTEALSSYWKGIEFGTVSAANRFEYVDFLHAGSDAWFGGVNSTATLHVASAGSVALDNVTFGLTGGYAGIVRDGGSLTCVNVDDGGFQYYVYAGGSGAQPTCPG